MLVAPVVTIVKLKVTLMALQVTIVELYQLSDTGDYSSHTSDVIRVTLVIVKFFNGTFGHFSDI